MRVRFIIVHFYDTGHERPFGQLGVKISRVEPDGCGLQRGGGSGIQGSVAPRVALADREAMCGVTALSARAGDGVGVGYKGGVCNRVVISRHR